MHCRLLALCALLLACVSCPLCAAPQAEPLVVGWHDEFTRASDWAPVPGGGADVSRRPGVMTLTLGPSAASDPHTFCWAGVTQDVEVNVEDYPILAVRVLRVSHDCWWDANVQPLAPASAEVKTDSLPELGLILFDIGAHFGQRHLPGGFGPLPNSPLPPGASTFPRTGSRQRFRLRLNVAGLKRGGSVDYAWVRFIRREDADRLRRQPDLQNVLLAP